MKIVFVNFKDIEGGAAIAAYRLSHKLEVLFQTENYFIVGQKRSHDANVFATINSDSETVRGVKEFIEFMVNKLLNKLGLQYVFFPFSTRTIVKTVRKLQPDIISLHNTHGGYFKTSLIKKLSRHIPIAWTLHDMWSFTANAAHTFGDESWRYLGCGKGENKIYPHIGLNTGRWLLKRKKRIYGKSALHVICPSRWIHGLAGQAPVFEGKDVLHIPHGVDLNRFVPQDKSNCRKLLNIPPDAPLIMFSSADNLDRSAWKGGRLLIDILSAIEAAAKAPVHILVLGKGSLDAIKHMNRLVVHRIRYIDSERLMAVLLSAADVYIYPTRADTMPLVLLEAIACGTPCISYDIGGCSDIVREGVSGHLVKPFDANAFAAKTLELLADKAGLARLSAGARKLAEQEFSLDVMAAAYRHLFKELIDRTRQVEARAL